MTVVADVRTADGARSSAGIVFTEKLNMLSCPSFTDFQLLHDTLRTVVIIQNGYPAKSRDTLSDNAFMFIQ